MKKPTYSRDYTIGQRVRTLRKMMGLSQNRLAKQLNISPQQLQKYEAGINRISASRLEAIAETLHLPISTFFTQDNIFAEDVGLPPTLDKNTIQLIQHYHKIASKNLKSVLVANAKAFSKE